MIAMRIDKGCGDGHAYPPTSASCYCGTVRRWRKDRNSSGRTLFVCGPPRDHVCDSAGPFLYGGEGVPTLSSRPPDGVRGYTWGSVSCSVCGTTGIDNAVWTDF